MSYQLKPDETLGDGVRRLIRGQIENAICASKAKQNGKGSPVHETRKHLKKARAALALVRGEVKKKTWKREDRCLAQVGQMISDVRDAEVRLETVRQLRGFMRGKKRSFVETEELLAFELDSFLAAFSEWPQEAEARLGETLERLRDWPLRKLDCKRLRRNVQRTYKRGRQDLEAAIEHMTTETLHAFRKRAKQLSYQMRILRPLAPTVFGELNDELKTIGECLGQLHDLAFVSQRLWSFGGTEKQGDRILSALIAVRTDELRSTAIALGERFYAERPRQFARRIARYFSEWETARVRCFAPNEKRVTALN
ncbi:MAG TPA: CHAD domain-containing protein [Chthoniobacterales bacterium]